MYKGQKSTRNKIQDFLCPFESMYISQGSNGKFSHRGIMANDVRGKIAGVRYDVYAPCDVKCVKIYPESGQAMWQSLEEVRFANGKIGYITFMTAHDDTFNAYVGEIVRQGDLLTTMGTKGFATGVHTHIQTAQTKDTSWYPNEYNIYQFNDEVDLDDCYFVDNTEILHGMGGNWKTTNDVPVQEITGADVPIADQMIYVGSKVKFDGIFKVDILRSPLNSNLFGCSELTGVSLKDYKNDRNVKEYHWIPLNDWTEVDKFGSHIGQDDIITGGISYVLNKNVYEIKEIDIPTNSARIEMNGRSVWVYSAYLYEVEDSPKER